MLPQNNIENRINKFSETCDIVEVYTESLNYFIYVFYMKILEVNQSFTKQTLKLHINKLYRNFDQKL